MKKVATTIRCVPRYGFDHAEVREVDLDLQHDADEHELHAALDYWFATQGIADAIYGLDVDDNGYFAIINDDVYDHSWGKPIL